MAEQIISQGTIVGERFEVERLAGEGDFGCVYKAMDTKIGKPVALRVIERSHLRDDEEIEKLRARVRDASTLTHRNIRATFGMGVHKDEAVFIATEWIEGRNLRELFEKRKEAGKRFSVKGAYSLIGHICNALTYAHKKTAHGSLSPRAIMVSNAGRVKVADWGLSVARVNLKDYPGRGKVESAFWAPEVLKDREGGLSPGADVFSLGALCYELLTGKAPVKPLEAPSKAGYSKEVDKMIARCMAADPSHRFKEAAEVKSALAEIVAAYKNGDAGYETDDDLGIDVEVDLSDLRPSTPPSKPAAQTAGSREQSGPPAGSLLKAPGLPPPPKDKRPSGPGRASADTASTVDMKDVLSGISKSETARWMVQKDKFDHGPFTDRELVQMILLGDVVGKHQLLNMDTGVRKKVRSWGDFEEYLERYRIKKKQQEEQLALERTVKAESRGTMAKWMIVVIVFGVLGLVAAGYFLTRTLRKDKTYTPEEMMAALDSGEIKLKTGGNILKGKRRGGGRKGSRGGAKGGSKGGSGEFVAGMSYEEAMNMGVNLGSVKDSAGQKQLTPADIMRIMDRNVRRFLPCMAGQSVKKVNMDIAIAGDGRVMGISVQQGNDKLKKCVASKVRSIKFPTSPAPRTAASWYFELY